MQISTHKLLSVRRNNLVNRPNSRVIGQRGEFFLKLTTRRESIDVQNDHITHSSTLNIFAVQCWDEGWWEGGVNAMFNLFNNYLLETMNGRKKGGSIPASG